MKKLLLVAAILFCAGDFSYAQNRYVVYLTDKNGSPYSVGNPSAILSKRHYDPPTNESFHITFQDFPVNPNYVNGIIATGAQVINTSRWLNTVTVEVSSPFVLNAINALPYVNQTLNVGRFGSTTVPSKFAVENQRLAPVNVPATGNRTSSLNYGISFNQVNMMKGDLKLMKKELFLKDSGFKTLNYFE